LINRECFTLSLIFIHDQFPLRSSEHAAFSKS
jgi:hypothetical protein